MIIWKQEPKPIDAEAVVDEAMEELEEEEMEEEEEAPAPSPFKGFGK